MKSFTYCTIASTIVGSISAIELAPRSNKPAVFNLDISRRDTTLHPRLRDRLRKRATLEVGLDNEQTLYFANVSLGSPQQNLRLAVDTGSSDIWANSANSALCQQYRSQCSQSGTYRANDSSSYSYSNSAFYIKYADGSYAQGDYATDTLTMGGASITNVPFGIGYRSTSAQGILGVGYMTNVAAVSTIGRTYRNLPQILADNKAINSVAYSLWLNDLSANTGSMLFGGVDVAKYQGDLKTLPIIQEQGQYREFIIALTQITAAGQTVLDNNPIPVLLDSGSSLSYLPTNLAQGIFTIFNARYSSNAGAAVVNCNYRNSQASINFVFSGVNISVPMNELVLTDSIRGNRETCILGISDSEGSTSVLGDTFLRSAYVVYDLSNNQISLAPTQFNATGTDLREIKAGSGGVPGASVVSGAIATLSVNGGGARGPQTTGLPGIGAASSPLLSRATILGSAAAAIAVGFTLLL